MIMTNIRRSGAMLLPFATVVFVAGVAFAGEPPKPLPLEMKEGRLSGPVADVIRGELAKAQFILWGEDHGFADSPVILRAIAREARPLGFKYQVVEVGPLSTRMIAQTLTGNGLPGLHQLVHQVPL